MATDDESGALRSAYEDRIGTADTGDEAYGYWVFAVGVVVGVVGIALFMSSESATTMREASIVLASAGIALLVAGPVIRLPLQRTATYTTYLGLVMCAAAIVWFTVVFPVDWSTTTGNRPVALLYAAGLAIIGIGGVFVPLLSPTETRTGAAAAASGQRVSELESELESLREDRDELAQQVERDTAASEQAGTDAAAAQTELEAEVEALSAELDSLRTSSAQFELYPDRAGEYRWRLRHRNGNVIASSGEGYTRKHNAQNGLQSVRRNALGATVVQPPAAAAEEPAETGEDALDDVPLLPAVTETESQATFELFEDRGGDWRWRLRHDNGNVIADSGEGYSNRSGVTRALKSVRGNVGPADYLRFDPVSFEVFRDNAREWRWRLVHKNGNILGDSGEGYTRRRDAKRAVDTVRSGVADGSLAFETFEDRGGDWRWRLRAGNDELVADSGEGYASESGVEEAVERIGRYAPDADALDVGRAAFEVYEDRGGKWRWRLRHRNGNIIADCGQGYSERTAVYDAIEGVKRNAPAADAHEASDDDEE
ncbi:HVO_2922 family protein [Haloarchaeobius iranensis]|uniref:Uncharacterized conserved protein YegP, UPF0339 family n=1 Tax=Haloarchaeobius iranensis TaxID=996166 RepID=A0A1G9WEE5_9EURY|nr:HVO_2922 family protein [Haloarchaeobius iranensis]SDM82868.1 Uncharacterized conserved protein YegP, UPF0339 family [Haloarchaeobius iranensis]